MLRDSARLPRFGSKDNDADPATTSPCCPIDAPRPSRLPPPRCALMAAAHSGARVAPGAPAALLAGATRAPAPAASGSSSCRPILPLSGGPGTSTCCCIMWICWRRTGEAGGGIGAGSRRGLGLICLCMQRDCGQLRCWAKRQGVKTALSPSPGPWTASIPLLSPAPLCLPPPHAVTR
jgi:hypothetical protein